MKIAITGTPGTGKTEVSKLLAKKIGYYLLELNKEIKKNKLYSGYDKKRKTYIADDKKVEKFLKNIKKKNIIIDSHLSHLFPADKIIVLRCDPKELEKRLKNKGWSKEKIRENVEAELIGLISYEAKKKNRNVYEIDTTKKSIKNIVKEILKFSEKNKKEIDWIKTYKPD